MRKFVIILPVLLAVLIPSGFAVADTESMDQMIPFASTQDDGGALGEKAKVQAMREAINSDSPQMVAAGSDTNVDGVWLTSVASLTAIREEDV